VAVCGFSVGSADTLHASQQEVLSSRHLDTYLGFPPVSRTAPVSFNFDWQGIILVYFHVEALVLYFHIIPSSEFVVTFFLLRIRRREKRLLALAKSTPTIMPEATPGSSSIPAGSPFSPHTMPGLGRLPSCKELAEGLPDHGIASGPLPHGSSHSTVSSASTKHPWDYRPNQDSTRSPSGLSTTSTTSINVAAPFSDEGSSAFARFAQCLQNAGPKPEFDSMYTLSEVCTKYLAQFIST